MANLGIIFTYQSTGTKKDLKKHIIKKITEEFGTLENFLNKSICETEFVTGYRLK